MESLEVVLRKVGDLKRDLSAEVIIQEEKGHYEHSEGVWVGGSRGGSNPGYYETEPSESFVVDQYEIKAPDTQKIESARTQLQQIYDSSDWYSARYVAGKTLNIDIPILAVQVNKYLDELTIKGRWDWVSARMSHSHGMDGPDEERFTPSPSGNENGVDTEKHPGAKEDLRKLYVQIVTPSTQEFKPVRNRIVDLLRVASEADLIAECVPISELSKEDLELVYSSAGVDYSEKRRLAGQRLGYSSIRTFFRNMFE